MGLSIKSPSWLSTKEIPYQAQKAHPGYSNQLLEEIKGWKYSPHLHMEERLIFLEVVQ